MSNLIEKARTMLLSHEPKSTPFSKPNMEAVDKRSSEIRGYADKKVVEEAIAYMDQHFPDCGFYFELKDYLEKTLRFGKNRKSKTKKSKTKKSKKSKTKKSKKSKTKKSKKSIRRR